MGEPASTSASDAHASKLSASWAAWEDYYRQASRRRRAMGGGQGRTLREEKRRRRMRERIGLAISAVLVGGLTLVFYMVLTR